MWIAYSDGWLSIVAHRDKPNHLLVRGRRREHLETLFPNVQVYVDEDADYAYRADVTRDDVANTLSEYVMDIEYDNFKNSVRDSELHHAYNALWNIMWDYGYGYRPNDQSYINQHQNEE